MNKIYRQTDLANECRTSESLLNCSGISYSENTEDGFNVSVFDILNEDGASFINKPCGRYITVDVGRVWLMNDKRLSSCIDLLAKELLNMISDKLSSTENINALICGLGNCCITSDALGSETVKRIIVTRHLKEEGNSLFNSLGSKSISAFAPGVIGQTGIETLELIRGAVNSVKPDIVIVIDALAASELSHLATTVQITDTGIAPGSGIGNKRLAINNESLGCPVIAIGVPTVVESSTLVYSALEEAKITDIDEKLICVLENKRGFFVTPKESDIISESLAILLSEALNTALS